MKGVSFITVILVVAAVCIFLVAISRVIDPIDYYYKYLDEKRKTDLKQIQVALEKHYEQFGEYPKSTGNGIQPCSGDNLIKQRNPNTKEVEPVRWGTKWFGFLEPTPKEFDPKKCYVYFVSDTRQSYWLYASLDRETKDPEVCGLKGIRCDNMIGNKLVKSCQVAGIIGKYNCNYGVSSVNE